MKVRVTTLLSLSGILVAGSAAALVNSQVLQNSEPALPGAADIIATVPPATTVPVVAPVSPDPAAPVTSTTMPAPSPSQAAYPVGMSGTVTVDTAGDVLRLVVPSPAPGWAVVRAEQPDPLNVSVVFQSAAQLVTFRAALLFGVVSTSTQVESLAMPAAEAPSTSVDSLAPVPPAPVRPVTGTTVKPSGAPVTTIDDSGSHGGGHSGGPVTTVDDHGGGSGGNGSGSGGSGGSGSGGSDSGSGSGGSGGSGSGGGKGRGGDD